MGDLRESLHGIPVQGLVLAAGGLGRATGADGLAGVAQDWEADWRPNVLTAVLPTAALREQLVVGGRQTIHVNGGGLLAG